MYLEQQVAEIKGKLEAEASRLQRFIGETAKSHNLAVKTNRWQLEASEGPSAKNSGPELRKGMRTEHRSICGAVH